MDPVNPNQKARSTPQYALYQRENFWKSNEGEVPVFNTGMLCLRISCIKPDIVYTNAVFFRPRQA